MYNTSGLQSERRFNKIYVCSLNQVLFSCKPSCTSHQGSLKYAGLLWSIWYLFFLWWLFFRVTLWDYIYSGQSKLFTLCYLANSPTKPKKMKTCIFWHRNYIFILERRPARLKVTERVVRQYWILQDALKGPQVLERKIRCVFDRAFHRDAWCSLHTLSLVFAHIFRSQSMCSPSY